MCGGKSNVFERVAENRASWRHIRAQNASKAATHLKMIEKPPLVRIIWSPNAVAAAAHNRLQENGGRETNHSADRRTHREASLPPTAVVLIGGVGITVMARDVIHVRNGEVYAVMPARNCIALVNRDRAGRIALELAA